MSNSTTNASQKTRANNINQSARLFTFCVLGQSECLKFEIYKQRSEKITPCFTPSVLFDIKLFTPKLTNSEKACFLASLLSSVGFLKFDLEREIFMFE